MIRYDMNTFKLRDNFLNYYKSKEPDWGPIGYLIYKRTYSRYLHQEDRKEEFWETVRRVVEGCFSIQKGHLERLGVPWDETKAKNDAEGMYDAIWNFKFTPPGRGFWIMGTEFIAEQGSMALNNCGFISTADIDETKTEPFEFLMYALMVGVGMGFDVKGAGKIKILEPKDGSETHVIKDSREGWVQSVKLILQSYFNGDTKPEFDFSEIRPRGTPLKRFGGLASGPKPLQQALENIQEILDNRIGEKITSLNILDIMNAIGTCVVAGGIRRSAEIALGDSSDEEFIAAKENDEKLNTYRWMSNNSIIVEEAGYDYTRISHHVSNNGEPGIFWIKNAREYARMKDKPTYRDQNASGTNPCGEQTLESHELCCLAEVFPSRIVDWEEFRQMLRYAYIYAKTVTLINTVDKKANLKMLSNRRIGISQTGVIDAFVKHGKHVMRDWCERGYEFLQKFDKEWSRQFSVPESIKLTTVKPSGTVSLLAGVSHGIHFPHSKYYIRRVRVREDSQLVELVRKAGYNVVEDEYAKNTVVLEFPIKKKYFERGKKDVTIWEQVENAAMYQKYWSDNQVSITVTFKEEEVGDIARLLESYEDQLKSISLMPFRKQVYKLAPYEEITKKEYESLIKDIKSLSLREMREMPEGQEFCDGEECYVRF